MITLKYVKDIGVLWALVEILTPTGKKITKIEVMVKKKNLHDIGFRNGITSARLYGACLHTNYEEIKHLRVGDKLSELKITLDCSERASGKPAVRGLDAKLVNLSLSAVYNNGGIFALEFKTKDGDVRFSRYETDRCCVHLF